MAHMYPAVVDVARPQLLEKVAHIIDLGLLNIPFGVKVGDLCGGAQPAAIDGEYAATSEREQVELTGAATAVIQIQGERPVTISLVVHSGCFEDAEDVEPLALLQNGALSGEQLVRICLDRSEVRDPAQQRVVIARPCVGH